MTFCVVLKNWPTNLGNQFVTIIGFSLKAYDTSYPDGDYTHRIPHLGKTWLNIIFLSGTLVAAAVLSRT